jgi:hypothetical protein
MNNIIKIIKEELDKFNNVWYHASPNYFHSFTESKDIGYHFGTKEQALDRMKQDRINDFYLYEVILSYHNPLRTIDKKTWFGMNLLDILSINKLVNRKEMLNKLDTLNKKYKYDKNGKIVSNWSERALKEWNDELKNILYSSNYDSIIYQNKYENKTNIQDSVIVFNTNQIKILNVTKYNNGKMINELT